MGKKKKDRTKDNKPVSKLEIKKRKKIVKKKLRYNEFDTLKRNRKTVELRIKGWTYPMIAKELGCSITTAWKAIKSEVRKYNEKYPESVERLRTIDLQRTDKIIRTAEKMLRGTDPQEKAIGMDKMMKAMELRAKYIPKLQVPKQLQLGVEDETLERMVGAEATLRDKLKRFTGKKEEGGEDGEEKESKGKEEKVE